MTQARAAVFTGPGKALELCEFDVPDPAASEVLVRVTGCTICGSDLHTYEGRRSVATPTVLGHEILGKVDRFGPEAARVDAAGQELRIGDRVVWGVVSNCGNCFYCGREVPQKCERMVKYGHETLRAGREWTGGLAEFCLLAPGTTILRLPDELSDSAACPASCATATVAAALRGVGTLTGRTVLVQGAGMLGLTACAMARTAGADEVVCCDPVRARLEKAEAFGATRVVLPQDLPGVAASATGGYGVDVALELSGAPAAIEAGLPLLRIGGSYALVGAVFPTRGITLDPETLVRRLVTLRGVHNYAPVDLVKAVRFLASAADYPFASLVSEWLPLGEADRAFERARSAEALRIGVRCD